MAGEIIDSIAHVTLADGSRHQVLNAAGDDWDEAATREAVLAYERSQAEPQ